MSKGWPPPNDPITNGTCGTFVWLPPAAGECPCGGEEATVLVAMIPIYVCCPIIMLFYQCYVQRQLFCKPCHPFCQGDYIV